MVNQQKQTQVHRLKKKKKLEIFSGFPFGVIHNIFIALSNDVVLLQLTIDSIDLLIQQYRDVFFLHHHKELQVPLSSGITEV